MTRSNLCAQEILLKSRLQTLTTFAVAAGTTKRKSYVASAHHRAAAHISCKNRATAKGMKMVATLASVSVRERVGVIKMRERVSWVYVQDVA